MLTHLKYRDHSEEAFKVKGMKEERETHARCRQGHALDSEAERRMTKKRERRV